MSSLKKQLKYRIKQLEKDCYLWQIDANFERRCGLHQEKLLEIQKFQMEFCAPGQLHEQKY